MPQAVDRHLGDDGDGRRVQELRNVRAGERRSCEYAAVLGRDLAGRHGPQDDDVHHAPFRHVQHPTGCPRRLSAHYRGRTGGQVTMRVGENEGARPPALNC